MSTKPFNAGVCHAASVLVKKYVLLTVDDVIVKQRLDKVFFKNLKRID